PHAPYRGAMRALCSPPRPCLPGRSARDHGPQILHQRRRAALQTRRHLTLGLQAARAESFGGAKAPRSRGARPSFERVHMHGLNRPIPRQLAPIAPRRPTFSVHHGIELVDEYAWLRARNWQEVMRDPAVLEAPIRDYLEAENAYTDAALADTAALQDGLYAEMKARIKEDDSSVPAPDGPYAYYESYVTGGQYPRLCRRPRAGGAEEVLLDGNREAEGKAYWQLGATAHSPDHRFLAYAVDKKGSELFTIK